MALRGLLCWRFRCHACVNRYSIAGKSMNLVKSVLRINFETPTDPWLKLRELMRTAASDPKIEMQAASLVLDRKDEKTRILLQIRGVGLEHETNGSLAQAVADARSMMARLHEVSPFPEVGMMRFDVAFIDPFDVPFHELVDHMKGYFLNPTRIVDLSSDIGLTFDQRDEDLLKHVQIGPMDRAQLVSEILKWADEDDIPDTFVFADLGYENTQRLAFSEDALDSFLKQAMEWQESEANAIFNELKEGGN